MPMINISHLCLSLFIENHKTNSVLLKLFFKIFALKYYYLITHFLVIIKYKINISFMYWNIINISINYGKYIGMPDTVGTSYIYMYLTRNYEIFPICAKDQYSKSDDKATNSPPPPANNPSNLSLSSPPCSKFTCVIKKKLYICHQFARVEGGRGTPRFRKSKSII